MADPWLMNLPGGGLAKTLALHLSIVPNVPYIVKSPGLHLAVFFSGSLWSLIFVEDFVPYSFRSSPYIRVCF